MHPEIHRRDEERSKKPINGNHVPAGVIDSAKSTVLSGIPQANVHALMGWYETPAELYKAC